MSDHPPNPPFDFDSAFGPAPLRAPTPAPLPVPAPVAHVPVVAAPRRRRGQGLAVGSLIVAVASAAAVGGGIFAALASIELSAHPLRIATHWMTLVAVGVCGVLLALAGSVVSEVRARPRTLSTVALVTAMVLPWIAFLLGAKLGADVFALNLSDQAAALGTNATAALRQTLADNDVEAGALVRFLMLLLG